MAHGLPDWYRGVDIAYQALSELITRPTYGGAVVAEGSHVIVFSNNVESLMSATGTGMIYGGYVRTSPAASQANSGVLLELDSENLYDESFANFNLYGISYPRAYPLVISKFDDVLFDYCFLIPYGLTFESSFQVRYREAHGANPTVDYSIIYALI